MEERGGESLELRPGLRVDQAASLTQEGAERGDSKERIRYQYGVMLLGLFELHVDTT